MSFDPVAPLREAIRLSPDNLPLRRHLADTLLSTGRADEAELEYRVALDQAPGDPALKLGLARAFDAQGKAGMAAVIAEELGQGAAELTPAQRLALARLLLRHKLVDLARRQYRHAIDTDPAVADEDVAAALGVSHPAVPADEEDNGDEDDRQAATWEGEEADDEPSVEIERPKLKFDEVGGLDSVKEEIRMKIIHPLTHADLFKAYGKKLGGGILLYGPPGCGKTYLARATAGEINHRFMAIGINDVLDMYIGNSEKQLHSLFEQARRSKPCVVFFDEVDALAASRADMRTSGGRHLINQFLAELDGVNADNDGLLILAATNAPWHVDSAFRRPGRFDRVLFVPPPDAPARASILRAHLRGKPVEDVDVNKVAAKTEGYSGADLTAVVDQAVEIKLGEAMKSGALKPIGTKDLLKAAGNVRPSTKEWFATARNHALYANDSGQYDDIVKYMKL